MFVLPELHKPYSAYKPYFDEKTMEFHHTGHHATYVKKLNQSLVEHNIDVERIEELFEQIESVPTIIRNNAGGHYNHTVFWTTLTNHMTSPSFELTQAINKHYGMIDDFKAEFAKSALELFGSGWTWLVVTPEGLLDIVNTQNQDNPLMSDINKGYPLFGLDLWEHAYYLKHQNDKLAYIQDFWALLDWDMVSRRFSERPEMNDLA